MIALIAPVVGWIDRFHVWSRDRFAPRVKVRNCVEPPERPWPRRVYVTHGAAGPAFGYMRCPCGCGETLHLRFFGERRPRWSVASDDQGVATLHPSVWRQTGCRSHFVLKAGRVHWC